ncbi:hypothetical protein [Clostridium tyrobutyricum]|uniref:hypothetical protein n=1 Tax=Clostridium tyrobutyricum TaxID=1519 RepID=UPI001C39110B|nr:hypothetical protein [Clostridium tyrobutyricum]MBV4429540.1 hypothetical protein [Clostridium tyrobutyricum]MBV4444761.1 hypothetical protein [Clostridium tyrobutyricum]
MIVLICIIGFILGLVIFGILNNIFDIYYFGFKGIVSTFMGCWFAGNIIVFLLGKIAKWLILICIIIWIISKISGSSETTSK